MLRLSTGELSAAFAGLDDAERQELMRLLEAREQLEAAKPVDTRQPISEFVAQLVQQAAAASADPEAYLAAERAHGERCRWRLAELEKAEAVPDTNVTSYLAWRMQLSAEAAKLATADGCPPADDVVPPRRKAPPVPVDAVDLTMLPAQVRADVEYTRGHRRASAPSPAVEDAPGPPPPIPVEHDRLAPFRGQPTGAIPVYRDGV